MAAFVHPLMTAAQSAEITEEKLQEKGEIDLLILNYASQKWLAIKYDETKLGTNWILIYWLLPACWVLLMLPRARGAF